MNLTLHGIMY